MKETEQIKFWKGEFGEEYTERNKGDFDELYQKQFGITKSQLNKEFVGNLKKDIKILEVGCNRGIQLQILKSQGFKYLWGVEINEKALSIVKENKDFNIVQAMAQNIPFKDDFFDLVFTNRVLIHIPPNDLPRVIDEIYRVSKKYVWGFEYFSEECQEINYRGNKNKLWKNNFLKLFQERHPDLKVVKQKKLKYLEEDNIDEMFLLEK